eukprot:1161133-Pelagomonas_calceolata.AAC.12
MKSGRGPGPTDHPHAVSTVGICQQAGCACACVQQRREQQYWWRRGWTSCCRGGSSGVSSSAGGGLDGPCSGRGGSRVIGVERSRMDALNMDAPVPVCISVTWAAVQVAAWMGLLWQRRKE